jgi:hypothetical protein
MRVRARRIWAAALATAVLTAGAAACTGGDGNGDDKSSGRNDKTSLQACTGGTFTWSGVTKTDRLTGCPKCSGSERAAAG